MENIEKPVEKVVQTFTDPTHKFLTKNERIYKIFNLSHGKGKRKYKKTKR